MELIAEDMKILIKEYYFIIFQIHFFESIGLSLSSMTSREPAWKPACKIDRMSNILPPVHLEDRMSEMQKCHG